MNLYSCLAIKIHFCGEGCAVLLSPCALMGAYIKHMTALNACFICRVYSFEDLENEAIVMALECLHCSAVISSSCELFSPV